MLDRIRQFLPAIYANDPLLRSIVESFRVHIDELQARMREEFRRLSASAADAIGIAEWEKELAITPPDGAGVELRRALVRAKLMRLPTVTPERLTAIANQFTYSQSAQIVHPEKTYVIEVRVPMDDVISSRELYDELYAAKPAHLALYIMIEIFLPVEIGYAAECKALIDASFCYWNRGAASFVCRNGRYRRNARVRRNRLDPDALYRERQYLSAQTRADMESYHRIQVYPGIDFTCRSAVELPVPVVQDMTVTTQIQAVLPEKVQVQTDNTATMAIRHWTNHRTVNQRNRTQVRDGTHRRNGRRVEDGLVSLTGTFTPYNNGRRGRTENL